MLWRVISSSSSSRSSFVEGLPIFPQCVVQLGVPHVPHTSAICGAVLAQSQQRLAQIYYAW